MRLKLIVVLGIFIAGIYAERSLQYPRKAPLTTQEEITVSFQSPVVSIAPERIRQGDPVLVKIEHASSKPTLRIDDTAVPSFRYGDAIAALIGVDLNAQPGTSTLSISFSDGTNIVRKFFVGERIKPTAPLGIPQKLGGNTQASAERLVSTLAEENAALLALETESNALWAEDFDYPLKDPVVTDEYGYTRSTVGRSISHKGTDFRAPEGTPVFAMNRGEVRLVREFRNYGKTVVIDHGLGLMAFYMHLSRIDVEEGILVEKGEMIGLSGQTGYAEVPHLHLTVRINHASIDPIAFLALF